MPATFTKMKSFIVSFHDFCLSFMHIFVIFNTSKRSFFKKEHLYSFKEYFKVLSFQKKIEHIKYGFFLQQTAATSRMKHYVIIVNNWKLLTIITKCSIKNVAAVLNPPLLVTGIK